MEHPMGVICKDAGGANLIASYILHNPGSYIFYLESPALEIFRRQLGPIENIGLDDILNNCQYVIQGLGINSFEFNALEKAILHSVHVFCYLDHWVNYRERFQREGHTVTPSEIWVSDKDALLLVREIFPTVPVSVKVNYYIRDMKLKFDSKRISDEEVKRSKKTNILYLSEPISRQGEDEGGRFKFDEFDALTNFLAQMQLRGDPESNLRLRMHPSEQNDKYDRLGKNDAYSISDNSELIDDLVWADMVFGVDTYAMYISTNLGIPTYCSAPDEEFLLSIPSKSILKLSSWDKSL